MMSLRPFGAPDSYRIDSKQNHGPDSFGAKAGEERGYIRPTVSGSGGPGLKLNPTWEGERGVSVESGASAVAVSEGSLEENGLKSGMGK